MRLILSVIAVLLALTACVPVPADLASGQDTCGSGPWQARAGQPISAVPMGARVIRPGDAITEDYSAARLNIDLDATDRIASAWCG